MEILKAMTMQLCDIHQMMPEIRAKCPQITHQDVARRKLDVNEFVKSGGHRLVPYYADILGAILPAISDKGEKIRLLATETNEELRAVKGEPADGFDVGAVLAIARRELGSDWEATRLEALHWILVLLERHRTEVLSFLDDIFPALLQSLSDSSDEVVLLVLEVQAYIARDPQHFRHLMVFLVHRFNSENSLLQKYVSFSHEKSSALLVEKKLCTLLGAERVYRELATILEGEADLEFATIMVRVSFLAKLSWFRCILCGFVLVHEECEPYGICKLYVNGSGAWAHASSTCVVLAASWVLADRRMRWCMLAGWPARMITSGAMMEIFVSGI
ncbi:unnamed protein product [Sphagnum balticum]